MSGDPVEPDVVAVGRVGKPRGVRGDVFVQPWTDAPEQRFAVDAVLQTDPSTVGPLTVTAMSQAAGRLVVHFDGYDDRVGAESLRGTQLLIDAAARPQLDDPDEFYDTELVGLRARSATGEELGQVREVLHAGGADYLVVDVAGQDRLVPFVSAIVLSVDLAAGVVEVDPPDGLFDV